MLDDPLFLVVALACGAVAVILFLGIGTFGFGKESVENSKRANKFMRWRIIAQFIAVVLILLFVYIRRQGG